MTASDQLRRGTTDNPYPVTAGRLLSLPARNDADVDQHLALVDALLGELVAELAETWANLDEDNVDLLAGADLPQQIDRLINSGGKRIRPVMSYLGWLSAGGRGTSIGQRELITVSAALELLHLFVLVHDDVMDESDSRRGQPTVHAQARGLHQDWSGRGDAGRFGESIAILVGDLAHAEAGNLVAELPAPMRKIWRLLVIELVSGQRRDLVGSAAGRRDLHFARTVAAMKSGRYTVQRPLQLGAAAAAAPEAVHQALACYGREVGEAFALRDDLLGVWGDPTRTGKPAGDDLISGKPTAILAVAEQRLRSSAARVMLGRVGTPAFQVSDVPVLQEEMQSCGVDGVIEGMISHHVADALTALEEPALDPAGVAQLTRMAHQIAWRDR